MLNIKLPKWNLNEIYKGHNDPKIDNDLIKIEKTTNHFVKNWKGKIKSLSAKDISSCLKQYEKIMEKIGIISTHSSLSFATNMESSEISIYNEKVKSKISTIYSKLVFVYLEIASINNDKFNKLSNDKNSKKWSPIFKNLRNRRRYQLSAKVEEILIEKLVTGRSAWVRLFDETSASLRFPFKKKKLTEAEILDKLSDPNSFNRKIAAKSFSKVLNSNIKTFATILNVISKDKFIEDSKRGFKSILASRNLENDIEDEIVENLVNTVNTEMPNLTHRYYKWKAKEFGKSRLDWWDRNAPITSNSNKRIEWEEAKEIILDAFYSFETKIGDIAKTFFDNNWIDAEVRQGKASGAFAHPSVPSLHPFILVNYQCKVRDVMTLAHELGHGVHQVLAGKQGYLLSDTPLTLAETASVFGEMLVFKSLYNKSSKAERKVMLVSKIEDMLNTVSRQIGFHEFEKAFHEKRVKGELGVEEISDIWINTQKHSLGPYVKINKDYRSLWSYIPHFVHTPFYVYAYAFGDCLVNSLWSEYVSSNKNKFSKLYINLLSSGGTKRHDELLKPFGLSARDNEFWKNGLNSITNMIKDLENITNE